MQCCYVQRKNVSDKLNVVIIFVFSIAHFQMIKIFL